MSCLLILSACGSKWDQDKLIGQWEVKTWQIVSSEEDMDGKMDFTFKADNRYSVDYGTETEEGKYWTYGDYLHTVEDGAAEKKVRIIQLNGSTIEFEMNRAGQLENVVLVRKE